MIQIGDDSISYDGSFFGGRLGAVRYTKFNEFLASTPPDKFDIGITITKVDQSSPSNTDGLPCNFAGSLITYKTSTESQFVHQMFLAFRRSLVAFRATSSSGDWREWVVPNYVVQTEMTFDDTTPPNDFPIGTTTMTVNGPDAQDTPNRRGGILKTIKTHSIRPLWTYQEFYDVSNDEKYIRGAEANDNEWREWKKIATSSI